MVKAILLKPLDGFPEGTEREFEKADFDRLKDMGAVREAGPQNAAEGDGAKAAPPVANKMASAPLNKARTPRETK